MTLIKSFALPFHPEQRVVLKGAEQSNRISVLLGVNGTQKSSILRGLLEDSLSESIAAGSSPSRPVKEYRSCATNWKDSAPQKIVAISSAATDRFPSKAGFGDRRTSRYDAYNYVYVGPRTGRNIVSRTQSVQSLVSEYLQTTSLPTAVADFIEGLSAKTTVPCQLDLKFRYRSLDPSMGPLNRRGPHFEVFLSDYARAVGSRSPRLRQSIESAMHDGELMMNSENLFLAVRRNKARTFYVRLDLRLPVSAISREIDLRAVLFGLTTGYITLETVEFVPPGSPPVAPEFWSAGQWALFSSLATAALAARNGTLVLIDEPETALHPNWQRSYISDLRQALSHCKGCHAVLATHSPLIVSSLSAKDADLIGLRLDAEGAVSAELVDVPVGWQANDVLEEVFELPSTRSSAVVAEIEAAMALIAGGVEQNLAQLKTAAKRLLPLLDSLPDGDVARQVIHSICRVSGVAR